MGTRDIVYLGGKEVAEADASGLHATQVDHLGSPRFALDSSTKILGREKFMPFGETLDSRGSLVLGKGFTDHEATDPSGLIYMQARFYAPQYHKFLSPDPARDQHFEATQSWNISSYVQNNPVRATDPTGMLVFLCSHALDPHRTYYGTDPDQQKEADKNTNSTTDQEKNNDSKDKKPQTSGAESVGQFIDRKGTEAALAGNNLAQAGWAALSAVYNTFTPGSDRLSEANAEALNGQEVSGKELAVAGGTALAQIVLTAAPELLGAGKPVQTAVNEAVAAGGTKSQPVNILGKLRVETHMEAVPKNVQKALAVKVPGALMKPWHVSIFGHDIPVNPFNPLWKLFK